MTRIEAAFPGLPAALRAEERVTFAAEDGVTLDGRWLVPEGARRLVVLAHPHPRYGGDMDNAVVVALAKALVLRGVAVLRFDFRGVGRSEGSYDGGDRERLDLLAALRFGASSLPGVTLGVAGYSFGSWVLARALTVDVASELEIDRVLFVAPAASFLDYLKGTAACGVPTGVIVGDRDVFCDERRARAVASHFHADLVLLPRTDHSFTSGRGPMAEQVGPFLAGETTMLSRL